MSIIVCCMCIYMLHTFVLEEVVQGDDGALHVGLEDVEGCAYMKTGFRWLY
jgi:coenzyme F420-reducing hydrogenase delta subunit